MIPDHILLKVKLSSTSGLLGMYNSFLICVVIHCVTCAPFVVPEQLTVVSTSTCSLVLIVYRGYSLSIGFSATIVHYVDCTFHAGLLFCILDFR